MRRALTLLLLVPLFAVAASAQPSPLHKEVETLFTAMTAALKADPASVARYYTDDASIMGGGQRYAGRVQIDQYWREATMFADWKLEVIEVGDGAAPWVRGRSTLHGKSGRVMATEFVGLLKRQSDGSLRFYLDMYDAASPGMRRPSGG
jgi:ketosteroid isomerase-like protein